MLEEELHRTHPIPVAKQLLWQPSDSSQPRSTLLPKGFTQQAFRDVPTVTQSLRHAGNLTRMKVNHFAHHLELWVGLGCHHYSLKDLGTHLVFCLIQGEAMMVQLFLHILEGLFNVVIPFQQLAYKDVHLILKSSEALLCSSTSPSNFTTCASDAASCSINFAAAPSVELERSPTERVKTDPGY